VANEAAGAASESASATDLAPLRDWLLALTAADVSVMIALQRLEQPSAEERTQPAASLAPGTVQVPAALAAGHATSFAYRVAVVDVQPKPPSKVREHFDLDTRLAALVPPRAERSAA
jgi:hypothetical protein